MTERINITRRRVLAGIGASGLAAAGAGLGTSAYLNDTESFTGNSLTAGELDLKVDWEEHYYRGDVAGAHNVDSPDQVGDAEVGLPDPTDPMVAVPEDELGSFMDGTAIEAYPDVMENNGDGNGVQDSLEFYDACADFANLPEDLDPNGGTGLRTSNDDTLDANGNPKPLVSLDDVKPGDFGELTLSFHLCDNPGYVWLQGELVNASENGLTEPEEADGDDDGGQGELIDTIQTLLWYDEDGDNVYEPAGAQEDVDLMVVFDQSESMNANSGSDDGNPSKLDAAVSGAQSLVNSVGGSTNLGLACFSSPDMTKVFRGLGSSKADINQDLADLDGPDNTSSLINDNNDPANSEGNGSQTDSDSDGQDDDNLLYQTDMVGGIEAAHDELTGSNARSGARKIMVLLGDGQPFLSSGSQSNSDVINAANNAKGDGIEIFTIAYGSNADPSLMASVASDPDSTYAFSGGQADIGNIFSQIGKLVGGEESFFRGTLRELLSEVSSGDGIPLDGDRSTAYDELNDPDADPAREHFVNSTNNFVGFAWWVPRTVGNEIQGDSVEFDLGFYTEQSRHNDGSGTQSA